MRWQIILVCLTSLTPTRTIDQVPPLGNVRGLYYQTPPIEKTIQEDTREYKFRIMLNTLDQAIQATHGLEKAHVKLLDDVLGNEQVRSQTESEFSPTANGLDLTILEENTARGAQTACKEKGESLLDIENDDILEDTWRLVRQVTQELQEALPNNDTVTYEEIWQELHITKEHAPFFVKTLKPIPDYFYDTPTSWSTNLINNLGIMDNCGFFSLTTRTFDATSCIKVKKNAICQLLPTKDQLSSFRYPLYVYEIQLTEMKQLQQGFSAILDKIPFISTFKEEEWQELDIFSPKTANVKRLALNPPDTLEIELFSQMQNFVEEIIDRATTLYHAVQTRNLDQLATAFHAIQKGGVYVNEEVTQLLNFVKDYYSSETTKTEVLKSQSHLLFKVLTSHGSKHVNTFSLYPLVIKDKQPEFTGEAYTDGASCHQWSEDGKSISFDPIEECCEKYILHKGTFCGSKDAFGIKYHTELSANEFLVVSSETIIIRSSCQNIELKDKGSFLVKIDTTQLGCKLFLDSQPLPIQGIVTIKKYNAPDSLDHLLGNQIESNPETSAL